MLVSGDRASELLGNALDGLGVHVHVGELREQLPSLLEGH